MSERLDNPGCILHVDMDAFFAAIEQRDHPELRGKPVVVGSPPDQRGVVSTASYEARQYGVHSAMPSRTAYQRCPHAIFVPVRHDHYRAVSRQVMAVFRDITPVVEPVSIDEAFLDVSGIIDGARTSIDCARAIKRRLRQDLRLTGSVGVALNKFLAKVASDLDKPDGLTVMPSAPQRIARFLAPLSVRKIWGVGPQTADKLLAYGIRTIGDVQQSREDFLMRVLGSRHGSGIYRLAFGLDDRPVCAEPREEKSISHEETFGVDVDDPTRVKRELLRLTEKVGRRLREAGKTATTAQIKVRFADFKTITRQQTMLRATNTDRDLLGYAKELFQRVTLKQAVRLIGFGVSGISGQDETGPRQLMLFEADENDDLERDRRLDQAVDDLRQRFGDDVIRRGIRPH